MPAASVELVSVIIPCRNAGPMLRPALLSVLEQSYPHIEIIFVDNGSTDASLDVARQVAQTTARPFRITTCSTLGVNNARNFGYRLARGGYIQWMDADDALDVDKIALQVAAFECNPSADIAYGDWTLRESQPGRPGLIKRNTLLQEDDQLYRTLCGIWYPPHSYLLRRAAAEQLDQVQAWWPSRTVCDDIEYSAIAALLGFRFLYVAGVNITYNVWSENQTSAKTSYPDRVVALEAAFRRLRDFAASDRTKIALLPRHKKLLDQSWDICRLPKNALSFTRLPDGRERLRDARSGKEILLRPREAAIARALMKVSRPMAAGHYALVLTQTFPQITTDPAVVIEAIELFCRQGFIERVDNTVSSGETRA
jgi:glycosyltransferase involved in cell wall biosynthesis